ncbi:MAG: hypothetical protein HYX92_06825 [Chloroflexi bacterium]|nr:hypothetical protein [Chloroflexota bacterium]
MPGESTMVIVILIAVALCLFPAGYIWYLTLPGWKAKHARAAEAERRVIAAQAPEEKPRPIERIAVAALFFLVAVLAPLLIWVAFVAAMWRLLRRAASHRRAPSLSFLGQASMLLGLLRNFVALGVIRTFVAVPVRRLFLQAVRRSGAVLLALLAAVLAPAVIWAINVVAIRELLRREAVAKPSVARLARLSVSLMLVAPVVVALTPLLTSLAAFFAVSNLYRQWRGPQLSSATGCSIDEDCPPGYTCIDGRCVPR